MGQIITPIQLSALREHPLVSVLVPNYNYGTYVGQAVESVLRQSYPRLEVIVCDDGSTDDSYAVVEALARHDSRVTLIRQENAGQAWALASAFRRSTGQIVCLLDSDDVYLPDKVRLVVEAFTAHPEVGLVAHRVVRINARGQRSGVLPLFVPTEVEWCGPTLLANGGTLTDLPPFSGLSVRREVAGEIFPIFQPAVHAEMADRVVRRIAPLITPVIRLARPLAEYRLHGANVYGSARIRAPFLERELRLLHEVWAIQHAFLAQRYPASADKFAPVEAQFSYWRMRYMQARLTGSSTSREVYDRLMHHPAMRQEPWFLQWFWKGSIALPRPIVQRAFDVLMGPSVIKQAIAALTGKTR